MQTIAIPGAQRPAAAGRSSRKLSTFIRSLRWKVARFVIEADMAPNPMVRKGGAL